MSDISKNENHLLYTDAFYTNQMDGSFRSALIVAPLVLEIVKPIVEVKSVVDIGCGVGTWPAAFEKYGVSQITGVDGAYVDKNKLLISSDNFYAHNLETPLNLCKKYDLAISVEVAEHISEDYSDTFIDTLCEHSNTILFSAAIPGQPGTGHINSNFPSYWALKFAQRGYLCCDRLRGQIWNNSDIEICYRQNIMLFIKKSFMDYKKTDLSTSIKQIDLVHPELFRMFMRFFP